MAGDLLKESFSKFRGADFIEDKADKKTIKNIESLNRLVVMLAHKLKDKKFDKLSLCYFINFLVGSLGLNEEDFEEFHRQVRDLHGDDDDEEDGY